MQEKRAWLFWNVIALALGLVILLWPALMPFWELVQQPVAWQVWQEWDRLQVQILHTLIVTIGSVLVALFLGGTAALLLARTTLKGRRVWIFLAGLALFIPLPMLVSGWYLIVQLCGFPLPALWPPWQQLIGALLLHGIMGVPWAALIIGLGFFWVETELEEEALLFAPLNRVLWHIILPRCWPFVGLAALVVAWPTWHEITVTDFFKVRTFAEEVYLQLNGGSLDDAARATAVMLPWSLCVMVLTWFALRAWRRCCPPRWPSLQRQQRLPLGNWQVIAQGWLLLIVSLALFIPLGGLLAKAGTIYHPDQPSGWSFAMVVQRVGGIIVDLNQVLVQSLVLGFASGVCMGLLVLLFVVITRDSLVAENLLWWLVSLLWALPGPLMGLGLLMVIQVIIMLPGDQLWSTWLYSAPSPVPNIWASLLRYFPLAWAVIWPLARLIPREWEELARLDGAGPWQRLWSIYWPSLSRSLLWVGLAVGILSLGEISASKLVTTPGYLPLSHLIFQQLHAGADAEVAALALTLLFLALLGGTLLLAWQPFQRLLRMQR